MRTEDTEAAEESEAYDTYVGLEEGAALPFDCFRLFQLVQHVQKEQTASHHV